MTNKNKKEYFLSFFERGFLFHHVFFVLIIITLSCSRVNVGLLDSFFFCRIQFSYILIPGEEKVNSEEKNNEFLLLLLLE